MLEELQQYESDITDVLDILDAEDMLDVLQDIIDGETTFEDIKEDLERLVKEVPIFLQKLHQSLTTLLHSGPKQAQQPNESSNKESLQN